MAEVGFGLRVLHRAAIRSVDGDAVLREGFSAALLELAEGVG